MEKIDRNYIKDRVHDEIEELFKDAQNQFGATGDISPELLLKCRDIEKQLTDVIFEQVKNAVPKLNIENWRSTRKIVDKTDISGFLRCTSDLGMNEKDAIAHVLCFFKYDIGLIVLHNDGSFVTVVSNGSETFMTFENSKTSMRLEDIEEYLYENYVKYKSCYYI